jgi:hypothetical protein
MGVHGEDLQINGVLRDRGSTHVLITLTSLALIFSAFSVIDMYGLDDRTSNSCRGRVISLPYRVQTGSGAHPASYPMGTEASLPAGKAAGA